MSENFEGMDDVKFVSDENSETDMEKYLYDLAEKSYVDALANFVPNWVIDLLGKGDNKTAIFNMCRLMEIFDKPVANLDKVFSDCCDSGEFDSISDECYDVVSESMKSFGQLWCGQKSISFGNLCRNYEWLRHLQMVRE